MSAEEFSNQFDVLFSNITSNQAPGLSEYEKSVFLTKAQDEILKNYFNPKGNKYGEGYDGNQKRQIDFSSLTTSWDEDEGLETSNFDTRSGTKGVDFKAVGVWIILNERVTVTRNGKDLDLAVKPISFEEYDRMMSKPFKRPLKYQAWRLMVDQDNSSADLIAGPTDVIKGYHLRYIRKPKPIIIGDLEDLTIDGYSFGVGNKKATGCELDSILHEEILQRAVELAKVAWTSTGQDNAQMVLQAGQRSE